MPSYKKLVRDRIPEIIETDGKKPVTHEKLAIIQVCDEKLEVYFKHLS